MRPTVFAGMRVLQLFSDEVLFQESGARCRSGGYSDERLLRMPPLEITFAADIAKRARSA